jgi:hypothetical protein
MTPSQLDALERLASLYARGALTDDEFRAEKARVLGSGPAPDVSDPRPRSVVNIQMTPTPSSDERHADEEGSERGLKTVGAGVASVAVLGALVGAAVLVGMWSLLRDTGPRLAIDEPRADPPRAPLPSDAAQAGSVAVETADKRVPTAGSPPSTAIAPSAPAPGGDAPEAAAGPRRVPDPPTASEGERPAPQIPANRVPFADRFEPSDCVLVESADGRPPALEIYCSRLDWDRCEESEWPDAKCPADIEERPLPPPAARRRAR